MERKHQPILLALAVLGISDAQLSICFAQSTAFTYQGRLNDGASAANGTYDLRFTLYDALSAGSAVAGPVTNSPTGVTNGLFLVTLDFGANAFTGPNRWLQIDVRTNGPGTFAPLTPRQQITAGPYAIFSANAATSTTSLSANSVAANSVNNAALQTSSVDSSKIADGSITANDLNAAVLSNTFWRLSGNANTIPGTHSLGTTDNQPLELKVNGARALRMEPATVPNLIGGSLSNNVTAGVVGAFIGGGGTNSSALNNRVTDDFGTVGGGLQNRAGDDAGNTSDRRFATVSGGFNNTASGANATVAGGTSNNSLGGNATVAGGISNNSQANNSAIGGGQQNTIQPSGQGATIAGGELNLASGVDAVVSGGNQNVAPGAYAVIPGGQSNGATANYSFAAGRRAKATNQGVFVWADSTDADLASTSSNQFLIRANGGVGIGTNNPQSALHVNGTIKATQFSGSGTELTDVMKSLNGLNGAVTLSAGSNISLLASGNNIQISAGGTSAGAPLRWQVAVGTNHQAQSNVGYFATNNSDLVTITLPLAPSVGDTIRIAGTGAGGWEIALNPGQTIVGVSGNILQTITPAGVIWRPSGPNTNWAAVASSSDGVKLVAIGSNALVYTSSDSGATWTQQSFYVDPFIPASNWVAVASSADGVDLLAAVNGGTNYQIGQTFTSTNSGASWTVHYPPAYWQCVASAFDGVKLVGAAYTGWVYTSTNAGLSWDEHSCGAQCPPMGGGWLAVASSSDGSRLVVSGSLMWGSTNSGTTWTRFSSPANGSRSIACSADANKLVAVVNRGQIYTSSDFGTTWAARAFSNTWQAVASSADGMKLVAAALGGQIYTSNDAGVSWSAHDSNRNWQSVASSADGNKLVAVVAGGQIYTSKATTAAGGQGSAIELVYAGSNQFIVLSSNPTRL